MVVTGTCNSLTSAAFSLTVNPVQTAPFAITAVTTVSCTPILPNRFSISFTPRYSGLNGQSVSFSVANELLPTTESGPCTLQLYTDNPTLTLQATQGGSPPQASFSYNWLAACQTAEALNTPPRVASALSSQTATAGTYFTYVIPDGTFTDMATTTNPGPYSLNLYTDNPVISLRSSQGGSGGEVSYAYNWLAACGSGSRVSAEPAESLRVTVLGNPVVGNVAEIEISGVAGQAVQVELVDSQGHTCHCESVQQAGAVDRVRLPLGPQADILLVRVSTSTQRQTVKLLRL